MIAIVRGATIFYMILDTPNIKPISAKTVELLSSSLFSSSFKAIDKDYLYWDKARYHKPDGVDDSDFWAAVKFMRLGEPLKIGDSSFSYRITTSMQKLLHEFDLCFSAVSQVPESRRQYVLLSSVMEEAIASSQMEGASTTRLVAKDMLRRQSKPQNRDQQMISNNYRTIRYLSEHKEEPLSIKLLLDVHRLITENTLDRPSSEGRFRESDDIMVINDITSEIAHIPPSYKQIEHFLSSLCDFINSDDNYVHPIVKAIILHFMISYLHPFVDGNGRTARSLFYWYMLKKGYWLTEFLSISRVIYRSKAQYEKAFLYVEKDSNDLGYFIHYNLTVLNKAFNELKAYLERKGREQESLQNFRHISSVNERQAQIIAMALEKPSSIFICKELETTFNVSVKTIRADLCGLVNLGLLEVVAVNQRLRGYVRVQDFSDKLKTLQGLS